MNIWIVVINEPIWIDSINERLHRCGLLADVCVSRDHEVSFFTSSFAHHKKKNRVDITTIQKLQSGINLHLLFSGSYSTNLSLQRLKHHYRCGKEFIKHSKTLDKPDVIFCAYPDIFLSNEVINYGLKNNIPVVIDIRDLWPDIFLHQNAIFIKKILFKPLVVILDFFTKKIFQNATALTGITPSFLNWAQEKVKRKSRKNDCFFPLAYPMKEKKSDIVFWEKLLAERISSKIVCFFGNLGQQFDFQDIFKFSNQHNEYTFVICGSGDRLSEYRKKYASERVIFPGWIDHEKILGLMQLSKAAIAPYKNSFDFQMSIPNKIVEYIYGGVPIVTSLDGDVKNLIEKKSLGFYYKQGDLLELKNALEACSDNIEGIKLKAKKVCKELFDFDKTYNELAKKLESLGS
jgi:glycosyltransferase involved in cell wall biosynthesis